MREFLTYDEARERSSGAGEHERRARESSRLLRLRRCGPAHAHPFGLSFALSLSRETSSLAYSDTDPLGASLIDSRRSADCARRSVSGALYPQWWRSAARSSIGIVLPRDDWITVRQSARKCVMRSDIDRSSFSWSRTVQHGKGKRAQINVSASRT